MQSVRDLIKERQTEIRSTDLQPPRAAEILTELAALLGNVLDQIRKCDVEYNVVLLNHLQRAQKASHAKIEAETTREYLAKREASDLKVLTLEMIRSLKFFLRAKEDEKQTTKYQ